MFLFDRMTLQEAVEKSKVLHLQVQTATFQKMVNDLEGDIEALTDWVALEVKRKSSWQAMVLTHARRRYVRGLERVREFAEESLRVRAGALEGAAMELADFRSNLESASSLKCSPDSRCGLMLPHPMFVKTPSFFGALQLFYLTQGLFLAASQ